MRKRIVFLDIDGVLNTTEFCLSVNDAAAIDPRRVQLVKSVFDEIAEIDVGMEVEIVISSTWRHGSEAMWDREIRQKLASAGWENPPIIGRTPDMDSGRGSEIRAWLVENHGEDFAERVVFAIVDDDVFDMLPEQEGAIVECDGNLGFTSRQHAELRMMLSDFTESEWFDAFAAMGVLENVFVIRRDASPEEQERQMLEFGEIVRKQQDAKRDEKE